MNARGEHRTVPKRIRLNCSFHCFKENIKIRKTGKTWTADNDSHGKPFDAKTSSCRFERQLASTSLPSEKRFHYNRIIVRSNPNYDRDYQAVLVIKIH